MNQLPKKQPQLPGLSTEEFHELVSIALDELETQAAADHAERTA